MAEKKIRSRAEDFFYQAVAPLHDRFTWMGRKTEKLLKQRMSKRFSSYMKVLIIGSGSGEFALLAAQKTAFVVLYGFSNSLLERTKKEAEEKRLSNLDFRYHDVYNLKYPDEEFDLVILENCLYRIRKPEYLLSEVKRVLKSNGILIAPSYILASTGMKKKFLKAVGIFGCRCYHVWSSLTYRSFLESCQFRIIESGQIRGSLLIQYLVARKNNKRYVNIK